MRYAHALGENHSSMAPVTTPPSRRFAPALLAGALALTLPPSVGARAQTTFTVEIGRFFKQTDLSKESMRFYPSTLQVHQGDVVRFFSGGFHGVALLPPGTSAPDWAAQNAGATGRPWSLFEPDADEGPGTLKVNLAALFPSRDCGWPTEAPCDFDGRPTEFGDVLSSGLALLPEGDSAEVHQLDFSVAINADPGEVIEVLDLVNPKMTMRIEVVPEAVGPSEPDALAEQSDAELAQDAATAARLHRSYSNKKTTTKIRGKTYRMAWAGVETATVSLRGMYPKVLTIRPGQGVRWNFKKNVYSAYTVTFPAGRALSSARTFPVVACDPDGDVAGGVADTQPVSAQAPYCSSYDELELEVPAPLAVAAGDAKVVSSRDYGSSGLRGTGIATSKAPYDLLFPKASPKKGFAYASMLHEISGVRAAGKVVVRRGP